VTVWAVAVRDCFGGYWRGGVSCKRRGGGGGWALVVERMYEKKAVFRLERFDWLWHGDWEVAAVSVVCHSVFLFSI